MALSNYISFRKEEVNRYCMMSLQFSVKQMVSCCQPTRPSGDNFFMAYACSADERKSEFDYMHIIQSRIRMLQFSLCVLERRRYVDCIRRRQPQSMRHQGLHSSSKTLIRILYFIACILVFNVELTIRAVKDLRHGSCDDKISWNHSL